MKSGKLSIKNPYFFGRPVKDPSMFFGRKEEIRHIVNYTSAGQSVSTVGERRFGKSSLLLHLYNLSVGELYGEGVLPVYLDLQFLDSAANRYSSFYSFALSRMDEELERKGLETLSEKYLRPEMYLRREMGFQDSSKIIESIRSQVMPILFIDEFESLLIRIEDPQFYANLRYLASNVCPLVISSHRSLRELTKEHNAVGSPFFNVFATVNVGLLTEEAAIQLISEPPRMWGIPLAEHTDFILALAGLHPFFLQMTCYYLFEEVAAGGIWEGTYKRVTDKVNEAARAHFEYYFEHLSNREKYTSVQIAWGSLRGGDVPSSESLNRRGLMHRNELFSQLFRDYLLRLSPPMESEFRIASLPFRFTSYDWRLALLNVGGGMMYFCADYAFAIHQIFSYQSYVLPAWLQVLLALPLFSSLASLFTLIAGSSSTPNVEDFPETISFTEILRHRYAHRRRYRTYVVISTVLGFVTFLLVIWLLITQASK